MTYLTYLISQHNLPEKLHSTEETTDGKMLVSVDPQGRVKFSIFDASDESETILERPYCDVAPKPLQLASLRMFVADESTLKENYFN
jgi:hypothetical protein